MDKEKKKQRIIELFNSMFDASPLGVTSSLDEYISVINALKTRITNIEKMTVIDKDGTTLYDFYRQNVENLVSSLYDAKVDDEEEDEDDERDFDFSDVFKGGQA